MKKILVATGGGDCPGLNAVIRGIAKAARNDKEKWEVWGSKEAFNGILEEPVDLVKLTRKKTAGIHVKGGTILKTTNRASPLEYPVIRGDGEVEHVNICSRLAQRIKAHDFYAVINIGGDGSQKISQALQREGANVVGVPKTIDNDLLGTDFTFGFNTAVQIATDSFDKLVTTAESHHRVIIMEVMGRDAGWIALHTAIAGGAEICIIPEIYYQVDKILSRINRRFIKGRGFVNIVIAEGAKEKDGSVIAREAIDQGDRHRKLGGVANYLRLRLEESGCAAQVRTTILGHTQRGGTPVAFDRILATAMGVKAFEMVKAGDFGRMVSFRNNQVESVDLDEVVQGNKFVSPDHYLVRVARSMGVSFGD